jgi:phosphocarrier protein HPr
MLKKEVRIDYPSGLHLRPAKRLVMEAQKFTSTISLQCNDRIANGKSIISLLQLGALYGETVWICADGLDEEKAVKTLTDVISKS